MITKYIIKSCVLDDKISIFKETFEDRVELEQYLEDFDSYDIVMVLNKKQLKKKKKQINILQ